jgi:hypothetical protein
MAKVMATYATLQAALLETENVLSKHQTGRCSVKGLPGSLRAIISFEPLG